ncbi:MAG: proton-translocating NADH-quinone oxidoreductase subunit M [Verrucomicrobiales bacterium]|nr:proton-translocating NADH-quinone oxidoreductase subunit M [Verrucomicrobiales bacterium]
MSPLTLIFLIPLLTAIVLLFVPARMERAVRGMTQAATGISLLLALGVFTQFQPGQGYQFVEQHDWMPSLGIGYHVGVNGINIGLILMGALVAFAAACSTREIIQRVKEYHILLLLMTGGILGAFVSLDIFMMYFLHELALVPTFIMIGVWGHGEDKNFAAFKITLYLSAGALLALAGLILLYTQIGANSFDLLVLLDHASEHNPGLNIPMQNTIFGLLLFGLGILVSLWPFHTWAPLGYSAAPTAAAMMHAGVIKKFGLYVLLTVALPLLPDGATGWAWVLALLALGNLLWCGLVALKQKDFTLLLGNSSVAHMGFVFLGIASLNLIGITGAVLVMIAHGLLAGLAFGLAGWIRQHTGSTEMEKLGGLLQTMPFVGGALLMALMAGCGLPGFANFAGEIAVFFGVWQSDFKIIAVVAAWAALVIGAVYMLRAARNLLHGPLPAIELGGEDARCCARLPFVLLLIALLLFGLCPHLLTNKITPAAKTLLPPANRAVQSAHNQ